MPIAYVRSDDGALMVPIGPHSVVNSVAAVLLGLVRPTPALEDR